MLRRTMVRVNPWSWRDREVTRDSASVLSGGWRWRVAQAVVAARSSLGASTRREKGALQRVPPCSDKR